MHYLKVFHIILEIVAQNVNLYISGEGIDSIYQILKELVLLNKLLKRRCLCLTGSVSVSLLHAQEFAFFDY